MGDRKNIFDVSKNLPLLPRIVTDVSELWWVIYGSQRVIYGCLWLTTIWRSVRNRKKNPCMWTQYKQGKSEGFDSCDGLVISNCIQIVDFSARVTLKFNGWPPKTIEHFFYTKSSFGHHFKSISEFKLELQSKNAQLGSKLMIFCPMWPLNLMDDLG